MIINVPVNIENKMEVIVVDMYVDVKVSLRPMSLPYGSNAEVVISNLESQLTGTMYNSVQEVLRKLEKDAEKARRGKPTK